MSEGKRKMKEKVDAEKALTNTERRQRLQDSFEKSIENMEALKFSVMDSITKNLTVKDLRVLVGALKVVKTVSFALDEETRERLEKWLGEHDKECVFADPLKCGAIGGRLTYSFTQTSLGYGHQS